MDWRSVKQISKRKMTITSSSGIQNSKEEGKVLGYFRNNLLYLAVFQFTTAAKLSSRGLLKLPVSASLGVSWEALFLSVLVAAPSTWHACWWRWDFPQTEQTDRIAL